MIDINITLFIQLLNFLITLVVLNLLLIRPVRENIKKRKALIAGFVDEAEKFNRESAARLSSYEATLAEARAGALRERDSIKNTAHSREQEILDAAHREAQNFLQTAKAEVTAQTESAMSVLRGKVEALAGKALSRVLD